MTVYLSFTKNLSFVNGSRIKISNYSESKFTALIASYEAASSKGVVIAANDDYGKACCKLLSYIYNKKGSEATFFVPETVPVTDLTLLDPHDKVIVFDVEQFINTSGANIVADNAIAKTEAHETNYKKITYTNALRKPLVVGDSVQFVGKATTIDGDSKLTPITDANGALVATTWVVTHVPTDDSKWFAVAKGAIVDKATVTGVKLIEKFGVTDIAATVDSNAKAKALGIPFYVIENMLSYPGGFQI